MKGSAATFAFAVAALLAGASVSASAQERGCKDGFCWAIHPPTFLGGTRFVKITKWPSPRSTHRNIRWNCEGGRGCQVEGDTLKLPSGGKTYYVSVQACTRGFGLSRSKCTGWTNFVVY